MTEDYFNDLSMIKSKEDFIEFVHFYEMICCRINNDGKILHLKITWKELKTGLMIWMGIMNI